MSYCTYCDSQSAGQCACGFSKVIGCSGEPACVKCMESHKIRGKFLTALLGSKRAERSNSVRNRLFLALIEALGHVRRNFPNTPERVRYAFSILRDLDVFSASDDKFKSTICTALQMFPAKLYSTDFADALSQTLAKHKAEASLERFGFALAEVPEAQRKALAEFCDSLLDTTSRTDTSRSASNSSSAGRSSGARSRRRFSSRSFYE